MLFLFIDTSMEIWVKEIKYDTVFLKEMELKIAKYYKLPQESR